MCEYSKKCHHNNCNGPGEYRAPRSRFSNEGYYYFCLEHIRNYNKEWDYFKDMTSEEIMAHRISDITWRRPTWSAKNTRALFQISEHPFLEQPIGIIHNKQHLSAFPLPHKSSPEFKAIRTLDLNYPFSPECLKKQYLVLVKTYHPDRNEGCRVSEERLKKINVAYKTLCKYISRF